MNMKKKEHMTWYDVTFTQFNKLQELLNIAEEEERLIAIATLLLGDDITDLTVAEFTNAVKELDFLKEECPTKIPPKNIQVNGRKYFVDCLLGRISTAQYIDFTNSLKDNNLPVALATFVIPEGHKYNDGYDMLQVIEDVKCMPIPIVNSICFFFTKQFNASIAIFQSYLTKVVKKANMPKELKTKMTELIQKSMGLVSSLTS